jgi:hypothetical protein
LGYSLIDKLYIIITMNFRTLHLGLNYFGDLDGRSLAPLGDLRSFNLVGCHASVSLSISKDAFSENLGRHSPINIHQ